MNEPFCIYVDKAQWKLERTGNPIHAHWSFYKFLYPLWRRNWTVRDSVSAWQHWNSGQQTRCSNCRALIGPAERVFSNYKLEQEIRQAMHKSYCDSRTRQVQKAKEVLDV